MDTTDDPPNEARRPDGDESTNAKAAGEGAVVAASIVPTESLMTDIEKAVERMRATGTPDEPVVASFRVTRAGLDYAAEVMNEFETGAAKLYSTVEVEGRPCLLFSRSHS